MSFIDKIIFENISEGFVVHDSTGKIVQFNKAALNILGLTEDQLTGRDSADLRWRAVKEDGSTPFPGDQHPAMVALRTGLPQVKVVMGINWPNNEFRWLSISALPIKDDQGKVVNVLATFEDITHYKKVVKELELTNFRLAMAAKAGKFGVWDWDLKMNRLIWDDYMYELFGVAKNEFKDNYEAFEKTLLPDDAQRVGEELQKTFRYNGNFNSDFRINRRGSVRVIRAMSKCFYDDNGEILRLIGVNWDVTEDHQREIQLIQSSKMTTLGETAANIAHEINNPLSIVAGKAHLALVGLTTGKMTTQEVASNLEKIKDTAKLIGKIVASLKGFSRDSSRDDVERFSLVKIVDDAISLCNHRFNNADVKLSIVSKIPDVLISGHATQIVQVLLNLLNNSFDAVCTLDQKWVEVDFDVSGNNVHILVRDSGFGISKEVCEKMMSPFFTTKNKGQGTGLGLSISKDIIARHGGSLTYDPTSNNTTFVVTLPVEHF